MKKISMLLSLLALIGCENSLQVENGTSAIGLSASKICAGEVIAGVTGTANCSGGGGGSVSVTEGFYIFSSRADNETLPTVNDFLDLDFLTGREIATLKNAIDRSPLYTNNYSVIPFPLDESEGRYAPCKYDASWVCDFSDVPEYKEKRHYLETIIAAKMEKDNPGSYTSRQNALSVCGASGNIEARITDCKTVNGDWAFYNGAQYGQVGEGDWSLVAVVDDSGTNYEVWRDERTKLLWSDKASSNYSWYRASGYSKPSAISERETNFTSEPGVLENSVPHNLNQTLQPSNPISVCPDVTGAAGAGQIAAGGGHYTTYDPNPETAFKGNLSIANDVVWKLPSIDDYKLADVNGIRKILPNMGYYFWSTSSYSEYRHYAWKFDGDYGSIDSSGRHRVYSVRCVAFVRD